MTFAPGVSPLAQGALLAAAGFAAQLYERAHAKQSPVHSLNIPLWRKPLASTKPTGCDSAAAKDLHEMRQSRLDLKHRQAEPLMLLLCVSMVSPGLACCGLARARNAQTKSVLPPHDNTRSHTKRG